MAPAFETLDAFAALMRTAPGPDTTAQAGATARNGQLTKPPGSLGRLEDLAIWYGAWRGMERPVLVAPQIVIFAGNHGVAARGVSAFPAEVTAQMVGNFQAGGAAINQLARTFGARMKVEALELDRPTADFTQAEALGEADCVAALRTGWDAVDPSSDLLVVGEMGIGNTTAAAAIAAALYGGGGEAWVGRGTGVDDAGLAVKRDVVDAGLKRHGDLRGLAALSAFGGREMAAMAGAMVRARIEGIPMILDGFICCAAAACLETEVPGALDHAVAGHQSDEAAHGKLLAELGKAPLLQLDLRLGEGSGAALAIGVLQGAVACLSGMATFAEAGVSAG